MKEFISHIDYLIQKHDCVIIPDFGGFVLNREVARIATDGSITPPKVGVGFNPDLKYNDGLLAESYMNAYSLSYDMACKRIADVVNRLNTILALRQPVQIGLLGKFSLDSESRLSFVSNGNISASHAETFGLSVLDIRKLVDIHEIRKISVITHKRSLYKRAFAGVGAAAAAILVFFVTSTPISENPNTNVQKSGMFTDLISISANNSANIASESIEHAVEDAMATTAVVETPVAEVEVEKEEPKIAPIETPKAEPIKKVVKVAKTESHKYFVIIGSGGSKSEAQRVLKILKGEGYKNANIVSSSDRNRIYIASFADKNEAEKYRATFVNKNPRLSDAWVYTKRN